MAAAERIEQIRTQLERLRKDSLDMVVAANKIVYQGVQRVADHELKALNDTYRAALRSLKQVKRSDSLKGATSKQIDMLQDAANRIIASAREAMDIVADTRQELTSLMQKSLKGGKVSSAEIERTAKKARKAVTDVRDSARKATKSSKTSVKKAVKTASKKAASTVKTARKTVKKVAKSAPKKARDSVRRSKSVVAESVSTLAPSPNSRASRATSRAKKAANKIANSATEVVDTAMTAASGILKPG